MILLQNLLEVAVLEICPELKDPELIARVEAEEKYQQYQQEQHDDEEESQQHGSLDNHEHSHQRLTKYEGQSSDDDEDLHGANLMQRTTGCGAESGEETT